MHSPDVVKVIAAIRTSHPDMQDLYHKGRCYNFYKILKAIYPTAEPYYSSMEGHVYIKIYFYFYDIRGVHLKPPADLEYLDHDRPDHPNRWGDRDQRRLTLPGASPMSVRIAEEKATKQRKRVALVNVLRAIVIIGIVTLAIIFSRTEVIAP